MLQSEITRKVRTIYSGPSAEKEIILPLPNGANAKVKVKAYISDVLLNRKTRKTKRDQEVYCLTMRRDDGLSFCDSSKCQGNIVVEVIYTKENFQRLVDLMQEILITPIEEGR